MRIRKSDHGESIERSAREDLLDVGGRAALTAPVCGPGCKKYKDRGCGPYCEDAPRELSSDPDQFPIEPGIAPLVFEIKRTGVFEPCWSCEGHLNPQGQLWKLPRVWFYCDSVTHVRILSEAVQDMHHKGKIKHRWEVAVTHSDGDHLLTTFSLHPLLESGEENLESLKADVRSIATHLSAHLKKQVDALTGID